MAGVRTLAGFCDHDEGEVDAPTAVAGWRMAGRKDSAPIVGTAAADVTAAATVLCRESRSVGEFVTD